MMKMNKLRTRINNVPHPNRPSESCASSYPNPPLKKLISLTPTRLCVTYPNNKLNHSPAKTEKIKNENKGTSSRLNTILNPKKKRSGGMKNPDKPSHLKMK